MHQQALAVERDFVGADLAGRVDQRAISAIIVTLLRSPITTPSTSPAAMSRLIRSTAGRPPKLTARLRMVGELRAEPAHGRPKLADPRAWGADNEVNVKVVQLHAIRSV